LLQFVDHIKGGNDIDETKSRIDQIPMARRECFRCRYHRWDITKNRNEQKRKKGGTDDALDGLTNGSARDGDDLTTTTARVRARTAQFRYTVTNECRHDGLISAAGRCGELSGSLVAVALAFCCC
jgi:hypothetical protein